MGLGTVKQLYEHVLAIFICTKHQPYVSTDRVSFFWNLLVTVCTCWCWYCIDIVRFQKMAQDLVPVFKVLNPMGKVSYFSME